MKLLRKKNLLGLCLFCALLSVGREGMRLEAAKMPIWNPQGTVNNAPDVSGSSPDGETARQADDGEDADSDLPEKIVPQGLYSYASCLLDADNDRVLFERHGNETLPMASTTKIMTLLVILEHASMDDVVTVSQNAAAQPDVQLNIRTGEQYRLGDLVYSLMLESHNDVAVALAEHVGGSVEDFCALMNAKASALGLKNTFFVTPNGLDAENHHTTAVELSKIASYAIKNPDFIKITNTTSYQFSEIKTGRSFSVTNKNRFLYMMDGAIGVKTGFTGKAGYCFVGALKRSDRTLIATVLACGWPPHKEYKWSDTRKLMEYGLTHFKKLAFTDRAKLTVNGEETTKEDFDPLSAQAVLTVTGGIADTVTAGADELSLPALLLAEWEQPEIEVSFETELAAPVTAGQVVGSVTYHIDGVKYASCLIRTKEGVPEIDFWYCLRQVFYQWKSGDLY